MKNLGLTPLPTNIAPGDTGHASKHNDVNTQVNTIAGSIPSLVTELTDASNYALKTEVGVTTVAGKTGAVSLVKADVGLGNVDNTSDASKPVSTATATALAGKAATGHTHVANDITDLSAALNAKIAAGANVSTSFNAGTGVLTISATGGGSVVVDGESVRDALAGSIVGAGGITVNNDDPTDTITVTLTGVTVAQLSDVPLVNIRDFLKATTPTLARAAIFAADVNHTHADLSTWAAVNRLAAKNPQDIADTTGSKVITRDSNGAPTGHDVIWPDGATGTYTGVASTNANVPGSIDSYTITYSLAGVNRTYTQAAVTRNAAGYVTKRPQLTVATT